MTISLPIPSLPVTKMRCWREIFEIHRYEALSKRGAQHLSKLLSLCAIIISSKNFYAVKTDVSSAKDASLPLPKWTQNGQQKSNRFHGARVFFMTSTSPLFPNSRRSCRHARSVQKMGGQSQGAHNPLAPRGTRYRYSCRWTIRQRERVGLTPPKSTFQPKSSRYASPRGAKAFRKFQSCPPGHPASAQVFKHEYLHGFPLSAQCPNGKSRRGISRFARWHRFYRTPPCVNYLES